MKLQNKFQSGKSRIPIILLLATFILGVSGFGVVVAGATKSQGGAPATTGRLPLDTCRKESTDGTMRYYMSVPPDELADIRTWIQARKEQNAASYVAIINQSSLVSSKELIKSNGSGYLYCSTESEKDETIAFKETKSAVVSNVLLNTFSIPQFESPGVSLDLEQRCIPNSKTYRATYLGADRSPTTSVVTFNEHTDYCLKSDKTYLVFAAPWSLDFDPVTGQVPLANYKKMRLSDDLIFEHVGGSVAEGSYKWIQTGQVFTVDQIRQQIADALGVDKSSLRPTPVASTSTTSSSSSTSSTSSSTSTSSSATTSALEGSN